MLRSIFSLIQNIIDSDKEYNNKKSNTVIYLVSNRDNTLDVDLEIDGQERRNVKSIKEMDTEEPTGSFSITTDQGDTVTCKHYSDQQIKPKVGKGEEKLEKGDEEKVETGRASFYRGEEYKDAEVEDDKQTTEPHGDHGGTSMDDFMKKLYEKQSKFFERDQDQITALLDQIQKMKKGMERLQEIAQQFNCSEKFRNDVEYLLKNVSTHMDSNEPKDTKLEPTKK